MREYDIVIIGGGSAGLAAAVSAYEAGVKDILVIERDRELGGILLQCIHDGFGLQHFKEELTGPAYAERFIKQLNDYQIPYKLNTAVIGISPDKIIEYTNEEEGFTKIKAKSIILATGCRERTRGAIMLPGYRGAGIMTAGEAQRFLNIDGYLVGKKVFILGSGDIGLIMARRMTLEGATVVGVAEIMPYSNGLSRNIVQCLNDYHIPLYLSHTVTNISGKSRVTGIEISQVDDKFNVIPNTQKQFDVDTLLLSVGLIPDVGLIEPIGVNFDNKTKSALVNESMQTNIPGIFACGNVLHVHDLVDYVTKESQKAGKSAARFVKNELKDESKLIKTIPQKGINYCVPQTICKDNVIDEVELLFRVNKIYKDVKIQIKDNDTVIYEVKKRHLAPAEMETIKLKRDLLDKITTNITLEVVEG